MDGTLLIKRANGRTDTLHSLRGVKVVEQTETSQSLDVEVYTSSNGDIDVVEVELDNGDSAFEMNGIGNTVRAYFGADKKFKK